MKISFKKTPCAICEVENYKMKYEESIDYNKIDVSPRHIPSKSHYRIVECNKCGLIYSNPIFSDDYIIKLYNNSSFINEIQVEFMAEDYLGQLKKASSFIKQKNNLLEIGCGNGCFLKKAKDFGFKNVYGVEPSKNAFEQADEEIKGNIINDVFRGGLYKDNFFDLACVIQVIDHVIDPNDILRNIYKVIKENGYILIISHNVRFFLTKILGEKSPMYDIGHIYLFDKITIRKLLAKHGFQVVYVKNITSRYTIGHILKLFPFPDFVKHFLIDAAVKLSIEHKKIKIMGGNMVAFAKKI